MPLDEFSVHLNIFSTTIDHLLEKINICQLLAACNFEFVVSEIPCPRYSQNTAENLLDILIGSRKFEADDCSKVEQFMRWVESKPPKSIYDETVAQGSDANVSLFLPIRKPEIHVNYGNESLEKQSDVPIKATFDDHLDFYRNGSIFDRAVPSMSNVYLPMTSDTSPSQSFGSNLTQRDGNFNSFDFPAIAPSQLSEYMNNCNLSIAQFVDKFHSELGKEDNANDSRNVESVMEDVLARVCRISALSCSRAFLNSSHQASMPHEYTLSPNLSNGYHDAASDMEVVEPNVDPHESDMYANDSAVQNNVDYSNAMSATLLVQLNDTPPLIEAGVAGNCNSASPLVCQSTRRSGRTEDNATAVENEDGGGKHVNEDGYSESEKERLRRRPNRKKSKNFVTPRRQIQRNICCMFMGCSSVLVFRNTHSCWSRLFRHAEKHCFISCEYCDFKCNTVKRAEMHRLKKHSDVDSRNGHNIFVPQQKLNSVMEMCFPGELKKRV